ncbi:GerMN domain-containing protein [Pasteuria penetrans]|uniref:GerMN domain-containing protein n=1 Tax=Pasteuria penetrans TaxID=86005 RepID=UPI000FAC70E9|nr:GerMN domain-containing protein [Pasteuria penetrans]
MRQTWRIIPLLCLPWILSGCESMFSSTQQVDGIDPPPASLEAAWLKDRDADPRATVASVSPPENGQPSASVDRGQGTRAMGMEGARGTTNVRTSRTRRMEGYFLSGEGYVVPYQVPWTDSSSLQEAVQWLVPPGENEEGKAVKTSSLPTEFRFPLPAGVRVFGVDVAEGVATVNFSRELLQVPAGQEKNMLSALVWTLTGFPEVREVNLSVEGEPLRVMPKQKTPTQHLTRTNVGINMEEILGVRPGEGVPVVLYFLSQDRQSQHTYYVPVTRMIPRVEDGRKLLHAVMEQLVQGPQPNSQLVNAVDIDMRVREVTLQENGAVVDFDERLLNYHPQGIASREAIQAIQFSLAENTPQRRVKITVNGRELGGGQRTYPVSQS